jgi:hypothetical protein
MNAKKLINSNISSFYLYPNFEVVDALSSTEIYDAFINWFQVSLGINPEQFDSLFILPFKKSKNLKTEQLKELEDFQQTSQIKGECKYCIIGPAKGLTSIHWNKILKSLEEPLNKTKIILFDTQKTILPATIKSRVIIQSLSKEELQIIASKEPTNFNEIIKSYAILPDFLEHYKTQKNNEKELIRAFYKWFSQKGINKAAFHAKFIGLSQWLETSLTFNNPISERAFFIFKFCQAIQQYEKSL